MLLAPILWSGEGAAGRRAQCPALAVLGGARALRADPLRHGFKSSHIPLIPVHGALFSSPQSTWDATGGLVPGMTLKSGMRCPALESS